MVKSYKTVKLSKCNKIIHKLSNNVNHETLPLSYITALDILTFNMELQFGVQQQNCFRIELKLDKTIYI